MQEFNLKININKKILALGAELDTALAYYYKGKVLISDNLGDAGNNPDELEKKINDFCATTPDYILTDLHPEYNSTKLGARLAKQWHIPHIKIQHHHAHIFSAIAEHYLLKNNKFQIPNYKKITNNKFQIPNSIIGIACDGTGYGLDGAIWGGEIMQVKSRKSKVESIERIGHLENQILLGGQLAVEEPARMLMAILNKFLDEQKLYSVMNKFYTQKTFKLLYSQLRQNFNCQQTSSAARVLDATCALLFGCNERRFKHQAVKILEENSSEPYDDIKPIIKQGQKIQITNYILQTTPLFEYLIKNLDKDKNRLAATVHYYLTNGLWKIVKQIRKPALRDSKGPNSDIRILISGGMANNQIFRQFFKNKKVLLNEKTPSGDPGVGLGQIAYFLSTQL